MEILFYVCPVLTRVLDLPLAVPLYKPRLLDRGFAWFLATGDGAEPVAVVTAIFMLGVLLVARLVLRHDRAAWVGLFLVLSALATWSINFSLGSINPGVVFIISRRSTSPGGWTI